MVNELEKLLIKNKEIEDNYKEINKKIKQIKNEILNINDNYNIILRMISRIILDDENTLIQEGYKLDVKELNIEYVSDISYNIEDDDLFEVYMYNNLTYIILIDYYSNWCVFDCKEDDDKILPVWLKIILDDESKKIEKLYMDKNL